MSHLIRFALGTVCFLFLFPALHLISINGNDAVALSLAAAYALSNVLLQLSLYLFPQVSGSSAGTKMSTYWMFPTIILNLLGYCLPQYITVYGWAAAMVGGAVMLIVNIIAARRTDNPRKTTL